MSDIKSVGSNPALIGNVDPKNKKDSSKDLTGLSFKDALDQQLDKAEKVV